MNEEQTGPDLPTKSFGALERQSSLDNGADFQNTSQQELNVSFGKLMFEDYSWKVDARKWVGFILILLLFLQNGVIFGLVGLAYFNGNLADVQIVFGVLVPATLGETAFMVKVIIEWLFSDIKYPSTFAFSMAPDEIL